MRTFPFRSNPAPDLPLETAPRHAHAAIGWLLAGLAVLTIVGATGWTALALSPPGIETSLAASQANVPLDTTVRLAPLGWVGAVRAVSLFETRLDEPNAVERAVPVSIETVHAGWLPGQSEAILHLAGALRPDARYRLSITAEALGAGLPLPVRQAVSRDFELTTPPAPRPLVVATPFQLRWNEPLQISWKLPIQDFAVTVTPKAPVKTWIDASDAQRSFVLIEGPAAGTTYDVQVVDAVARNGIRLQQPSGYQVVAPVRPQPLAKAALPAFVGVPVPVRWNVPIESLEIQVPPEISATWQTDDRDPSLVRIQLDGLAQGATYELRVPVAIATSGAPIAAPATIEIATAPPLARPAFETGASSRLVPVDAQPMLRFASPILDRRAAEAAISIDPPVRGHFEWPDAQSVQFVPEQGFPYETEIGLSVRSGRDGPRASDGGYLEEDAHFAFTTMTNKVIDVDLSRQVMHLYEGEQLIRSIPVATGVPGGETPTGEYFVQYKMPVARFRGVNPSGSTYDIPDVHWVLPFWGDYTIHGAYWRSNFGTPGSAGCISMSDPNALIVYNWAPVGTPVRIHY